MITNEIHKYSWRFDQKNTSISNQYKVEFSTDKNISLVIPALVLRIVKTNKLCREHTKLKPIYYKRAFHLILYIDDQLIFDTNDLPDEIKISKLTFSEDPEEIRNFAKTVFKLCNYFLQPSISEINLEKKNTNDERIEKYLQGETDCDPNNISSLTAALICNGIENSAARHLANKYFSNSISDLELVELLNWAERTIELFGKEKIDELIALPKLAFRFQNLSQLYKLKSNMKSSDIDFMIDGEAFSLVSASATFKIIDSSGKTVGHFDLTRFETNPEYKLSKPKLLHFLHFANDPINYISYYGYQTGNCGFCHSKLTDPISCKWGYGKKCAENYGLDWG